MGEFNRRIMENEALIDFEIRLKEKITELKAKKAELERNYKLLMAQKFERYFKAPEDQDMKKAA